MLVADADQRAHQLGREPFVERAFGRADGLESVVEFGGGGAARRTSGVPRTWKECVTGPGTAG